MYFDAEEGRGQITLGMIQRAFAESMKPTEFHPPVFFCKPDEVKATQALIDKIFGK